MPPTPPLPTLEIITHIWAGQLPQYAYFAHYQLSSLFLYPPATTNVTYTACYCADDPLTSELLHRFFWRTAVPRPNLPAIKIHLHSLPHDRLMRRAIGRNECALASTADVVYFAGCDYAWGPGALDALAAASIANPGNLIYPRSVFRHKTNATGEIAAEQSQATGFENLIPVNLAQFEPSRMPRAIGCLQIVSGDVARTRGYLPSSARFQKPAGRWQRTFEDAKARNWFGAPSLAVDVPDVYRFRHEKQGRFVDGEGNTVAKPRRWARREIKRRASVEDGD